MKKITVKLPDGTFATRRTEADYTHAVVQQTRNGAWRVVSFHTRKDLAMKRRSTAESRSVYLTKVVDVIQP